MTKLKRLKVTDYKMLSKKERYINDPTEIFSGEISAAIAYLQGILDEGYTHLDSWKWVDHDYGHEYAVCETTYYRVREETDEEYQTRCEDAKKRNAREKLRKEAKAKVMETLSPEQREALGL